MHAIWIVAGVFPSFFLRELVENGELGEQKCVQNSCHCFAGLELHLPTESADIECSDRRRVQGSPAFSPNPPSTILHPASCVLHPLWLKAFVAAAVPLNMSLVFGPCVADLFTAGWAPKYNLSFWSNEFGKGSSQLEKCKAYFREPSPAKFECMQKCFFCGMEISRKCHHNWQFKWPLL